MKIFLFAFSRQFSKFSRILTDVAFLQVYLTKDKTCHEYVNTKRLFLWKHFDNMMFWQIFGKKFVSPRVLSSFRENMYQTMVWMYTYVLQDSEKYSRNVHTERSLNWKSWYILEWRKMNMGGRDTNDVPPPPRQPATGWYSQKRSSQDHAGCI